MHGIYQIYIQIALAMPYILSYSCFLFLPNKTKSPDLYCPYTFRLVLFGRHVTRGYCNRMSGLVNDSETVPPPSRRRLRTSEGEEGTESTQERRRMVTTVAECVTYEMTVRQCLPPRIHEAKNKRRRRRNREHSRKKARKQQSSETTPSAGSTPSTKPPP
jgi:hypothetical protein